MTPSLTSSATGRSREHVVEAGGHDPVGQHVAPGALEREHGVAPAAPLVEADGQPGDDRDRPAAVEGQHVVGGRAGGRHGGVRREQLGPVAPQPQGGRGDAELGVRRRRRAARPGRRSRRAGGCRGRPGCGPTARCPGRRPARRGSVRASSLVASPLLRPGASSAATRPSTTARTSAESNAASTAACIASSYAASGSVQVVCSPASRMAFSAYWCRRSRLAGQAPTTACHSSDPKPGSGSGTSASSRSSAACQTSGSSASTAIRARVSSLRLVSWVVVAVIASGQSRCRSAIAAWKSDGSTEKCAGSPPTSLSDVSRE